MVDLKTQGQISTVSGQFYAGMTADEAKKKNLYKSTFSRDFTDIDQNKNGKLEDWEICNERDRECKWNKWGGVVVIANGALNAGVSLLAEGITLGTSSFGFFAGMSAVAGGSSLVKNAVDEQKITDQYRKEHGLDIVG